MIQHRPTDRSGCNQRWLGAFLHVAGLLLVAANASGEPKVETVLRELNRPTSVAIQPKTGAIVVSEAGAGRIVKVLEDQKTRILIAGKVSDRASEYNEGVLALAFFDQETLLVADGGFREAGDIVHTFTLADTDDTLDYPDDAQREIDVGTPDKESTDRIRGIALGKSALFAAGDTRRRGGVARAQIDGTKFGKLELLVTSATNGEARTWAAIAIGPRGEVVVGPFSKDKISNDRSLVFFHGTTGRTLLELQSDLSNIIALAYHPKTNLLYALDLGSEATSKDPAIAAGLYRIDRSQTADFSRAGTTRIATLERPTAMAFAPDGTLYVTVLGAVTVKEPAKAGQLLKLTLQETAPKK